MMTQPPAGEHYRLLFEHNPQPMWVFDVETLEFLTVNEAAIARYGYSRDEFLSMRITDIRPEEDLPALHETLSSMGDGPRQPEVWRHRRRDGGIMLIEITSHDIPFDGRLGRLVLAHDVTERERAIEDLRASHESYERQYTALAALTRRGILQTADRDAALRAITEDTARTLDIERVSVWHMTPERDAIVAHDLFERSAGKHTSDIRLAETDYPGYFRALAENDVLAADDAERDERTCEFADGYLRPQGITSMLDAPIIVDGELAGVLCLEHVGPQRRWTAGERSFAISAANLVALIMAQQSLSQSRGWLQTILDSEPECVSLVSLDGSLLEMNPAGLRMIDAADRASVLGIEALQLVHPADRASYQELLGTVRVGATGQIKYRIIGLKGTERWMETHAAPLRSNGVIVATLAVTRDISDRMRAEDALYESKRRLSTLMDHLPGMAYRGRNEPGRPMEFISDGAAALTGYNAPDLLEGGKHACSSLIHPADRERVWQAIQDAVVAREPFEIEYRIIGADSTEKWVWERGQLVPGSDGEQMLEGFVADVTQRRRIADALSDSEERFRLVARATSDAIYDWIVADDALWWSDGSEQLFGISRDELGDTLSSWGERIHPDDQERVMNSLNGATGGNVETWSEEYRFRRGDGSYAVVSDRGYLMRNPDGTAHRMIGGVSDLTERRQLEDQLFHSQKMESVGRLAGGVAHDFNNLLTVILGTVDLILSGMRDGDPLSTELTEVRHAAERAAGLTQQLLAFSRRQVLQPRVVNINAVVADTLALLRRLIGEDIEIEFHGADLWNVRADPGQLQQVLLNIAVNARDAMPTGGRLKITTDNVMVDEAYAAANPMARSGPHVSLTISDTGTGMDATTREQAFEPFFTTKGVGQGTGLGLATVYGIVEQSGGSVRLFSEPGQGTTIQIYLPRADEPLPGTVAPSSEPSAGGRETILLVEDEAAVRRLAERVLSNAGYTVLAVGSAADALATIDSLDGPVHLLLTDVVMPQVNGPELARRIAQRSPETRILFMSGYTDEEIVRHGVPAGLTRFLEKPFTVFDLTLAVRAALSD